MRRWLGIIVSLTLVGSWGWGWESSVMPHPDTSLVSLFMYMSVSVPCPCRCHRDAMRIRTDRGRHHAAPRAPRIAPRGQTGGAWSLALTSLVWGLGCLAVPESQHIKQAWHEHAGLGFGFGSRPLKFIMVPLSPTVDDATFDWDS
jgi:hypothetical protein